MNVYNVEKLTEISPLESIIFWECLRQLDEMTKIMLSLDAKFFPDCWHFYFVYRQLISYKKSVDNIHFISGIEQDNTEKKKIDWNFENINFMSEGSSQRIKMKNLVLLSLLVVGFALCYAAVIKDRCDEPPEVERVKRQAEEAEEAAKKVHSHVNIKGLLKSYTSY